jgi:hypothetical protein
MSAITPPADGSPYCGHCGYSFAGLSDSSRCPECGKAIVEVLQRPTFGRKRTIRYRSATTFMDVPLVCVALGPAAGEKYERAVGVIAIGDIATGAIACGLIARGGLCLGTLTFGVVSIGSLAFGVVALGAGAIGAFAAGGFALGGVAVGGCAIGFLKAFGGFAYKIPL